MTTSSKLTAPSGALQGALVPGSGGAGVNPYYNSGGGGGGGRGGGYGGRGGGRGMSSSKDISTGTGYGGGYHGETAAKRKQVAAGMKRAAETERKSDAVLAAALRDLTAALARFKGDSSGIMGGRGRRNVGRAARDAVTGAGEVIHGLLINESLVDWAARHDLYREVLNAVQAFAARGALATLLLEPPSSSRRGGEDGGGGGGGDASVSSWSSRSSAEALETLEKQAKVFVERAGRSTSTAAGRTIVKNGVATLEDPTLELSQSIMITSETIRAAAGRSNKKKKEKRQKGGAEGRYVNAMRGLLFATAPLLAGDGRVLGGGGGRRWVGGGGVGKMNKKPAAVSDTIRGGGGEEERKRSLRIAKEVSSLAVSLPVFWASTICVRVDDENMSVLRALILPSTDTPYGGGAFEFDVRLPWDYPDKPPQVTFLTTGGGTVRFNPNLYESGKVCLSLLGTWAGPGWDPKTSTLLQVLVSIQSLILCEEPYANEPGFENSRGSAMSKIYNARIRLHTLRTAMLPALKRIRRGGGGGGGGGEVEDPFREVLRLHYRHKLTEFVALTQRWYREHSELLAELGGGGKSCFNRKAGGSGGGGGSMMVGYGWGTGRDSLPTLVEFSATVDEARRALLEEIDGGGGAPGGGASTSSAIMRQVSSVDQRSAAAAAAEKRMAL